jgi:hypothetical protein
MLPPAVDTEDLVASALAFLANDPERLTRFFILTGLSPDTIREAARAPGFAASVLDYLLGEEPLLVLFASASNLRPEDVVQMRASLEQSGPEVRRARAPIPAVRGTSNLSRRFT